MIKFTQFKKDNAKNYIHCVSFEQLYNIVKMLDKTLKKEEKVFYKQFFKIYKDKTYVSNLGEIGNIDNIKQIYANNIFEYDEIIF